MNKKLFLFITPLFLALIMMFSGCRTRKSNYPGLDMSTLRVGITPDFPPLIFEKNGKYCGVEADFARKAAKDLGVSLKFVPLKWLDLIPALTDNRIDVIMSAMTVTAERKQRVLFTKPYFTISQMALIRTKDINKFPDSKSIIDSRAKIGVVSETTGDYFVREHCKRARRIPFSNFEQAKEELLKGRIDVVISDASSIASAKDPNLVGMYDKLNSENLAWAVNRKDRKLQQVLNLILEKWKKDGTLEKIKSKWLTNLIRTKIYSPK